MSSNEVAVTVSDVRRNAILGYSLKVIDPGSPSGATLTVTTYPGVMGGMPIQVFDMGTLPKVKIVLTHSAFGPVTVDVSRDPVNGLSTNKRSVFVGFAGHPSSVPPLAGSLIFSLDVTMLRVARSPIRPLAHPVPPGTGEKVVDDPGGVWANPSGGIVGIFDGGISNYPIVPGPLIAKDEKAPDWGRFHSATKAAQPRDSALGTWFDWLEYGDAAGSKWLCFIWVIGRAGAKPAPNATDVLVFYSPNTDIPAYGPKDLYPYKRKFIRKPADGTFPLVQPYMNLPYAYLSAGSDNPKKGRDFGMAYQAMAADRSLVFIMPIQRFGFWGPLQAQNGLARLISEVLVYVGDNTVNATPPASSFNVRPVPTLGRVAVAGYSAGMGSVRTLLKMPTYKVLADFYANSASAAKEPDRTNMSDWARQLRALPESAWSAPEAPLQNAWKEIWSIDGYFPKENKAFQDEMGDWFTRTNDSMLRIYATDQRFKESEVIAGTKLDAVFAGVTAKVTGAAPTMAKEFHRGDNRASFAWFTEKFMTFTGVDYMPSGDEPGIDAHHTIPRVVLSHAVNLSRFNKP